MRRFADPFAALHGHLFAWVPVFLGLGIGLYFSLMAEPDIRVYLAAAGAALIFAGLWRLGPLPFRPAALGLLLVAAGLLLAGGRAHLVASPVLGFRYYGPVEGRVLLIDRSSSDQLRLTLDRVVLERMDPGRTPARVRITVGGTQPHIRLEPGQIVMLTAFLSPPEGPVEPGGFDFQRMAWFLRLGAVGFSRSPVMALQPPEPGQVGLYFARLRQSISDGVRARFPGDAGGFVTAVLTNDTSGLSREALDSLRASNLAHILSISGLHMSLLAAFVFAALRHGIALVPVMALRVSSKKIAACAALLAAGFYYGLSGGAVATQRSFVMIAVMLVAILLDRRAITLRSVAIAGIIVLVLQPESLLQPGFQMSFAATVALVAAFAAVRELPQERWRLPGWLRPVAALALASVVAGAATAPYGAAAFNKLSGYGLLANMAAEPVMAVLVMPGAVIAAVLALVGLSDPALWVMVQGARWILAVSDWIAGLDGAVVGVVAPPVWVLPVLTLGGLWLILIPFRARWAGMVPVAAALVLWAVAERPGLLITENAALIGLMTPEGRALSRGTGEKFTAQNWLENDGDLAGQRQAAARPGFAAAGAGLSVPFGPVEVLVLSGSVAEGDLAGSCKPGRLLILAEARAADPPRDLACRVIDRRELALRGALAVRLSGADITMTGAREWSGKRLWTVSPGPNAGYDRDGAAPAITETAAAGEPSVPPAAD